jgi:hypothetical protein
VPILPVNPLEEKENVGSVEIPLMPKHSVVTTNADEKKKRKKKHTEKEEDMTIMIEEKKIGDKTEDMMKAIRKTTRENEEATAINLQPIKRLRNNQAGTLTLVLPNT